MSEQKYTGKQVAAIAELCGYLTNLDANEGRVRPDDLCISERPHNGDPKEDRVDLTVSYLSADIAACSTIDCYGNGHYRVWVLVDWVHNDASEDCDCDECKESGNE